MLHKLILVMVCFSSQAISISQNITDSLVAYYSFCDCAPIDISGNNRHGTFTGSPQCVDGINGKGLILNEIPGSNDCGIPGGENVKLPALGAIWEKGITLCAWVKFDSENYYERIVDFSNGAPGDEGGLPIWFGRENVTNDLAMESWINSDGMQARGTGKVIATGAILNGVLQHYSATIVNDTMRLYVNGIMVAEKKGNPILNVGRSTNHIGRSTWYCNDPDFSGFIDEVRIYNRALSPEEIMLIYNDSEPEDFEVQVSCNAEAVFTIPEDKAVDSVRWSFGDPVSGPNNTALGNNATHQFTAPGIYSVQSIAYKYCKNDTITKEITVDAAAVLSASIAVDRNNVCAGEEMLFTATTNATFPAYQWQVNGMDAGTGEAEFSTNALSTNDQVTCIVTSTDACGGSITSNIIIAKISAGISPEILIDGVATGICYGSEVSLTATTSNEGNSPLFEWQINGVNAGTNSDTFSSTALESGDIISCILTSNANCTVKNKDTSNAITATIIAPVTPFIEVTTTATTACENELMLFNTSIQNGGATPGYQWLVNGISAGASPTFNSTALKDGDAVSCILASDITCATRQSDTSDAITVTISETVTPSLTLTASSNNICQGSLVTFTAMPENAGSSYTYQWYVNEGLVSENSDKFTRDNFSDGDIIRCELISNSICAVPNIVTAQQTLNVSELISSVTEKQICEGETFWGYTTQGTYTDQFVSAAGCDSIRTLHLSVVMKPVPFLGNDTTVCTGEMLQLTPGLFDSYLWNNGSTQSSIAAMGTGIYTVTVTGACGTATTQIKLTEKSCGGDIWFPSAFSPNGDNLNEKFGILNAGHLESYYLSVYNRWGEKIFETTNPSHTWDGRTKGIASPIGLYTWYCILKKSGTIFKKKGHVTITR